MGIVIRSERGRVSSYGPFREWFLSAVSWLKYSTLGSLLPLKFPMVNPSEASCVGTDPDTEARRRDLCSASRPKRQYGLGRRLDI